MRLRKYLHLALGHLHGVKALFYLEIQLLSYACIKGGLQLLLYLKVL